jgi:hypothetical protein
VKRGKNGLERVPQPICGYQTPRSADDKRLVNDRTRDEAQDQNALVPDGFVGDGDAHEASIVLFLPEVLDASGVTPKRSLL